MAHMQQKDFCEQVKHDFPQYFTGVLVLDIGSLDINGNNQYLLDADCVYLGIDVAQGKNVDIVCQAYLLKLPDSTFDVIVSTECLEHDRYYIETLDNIQRLLKPGGLFVMTCATTGRAEHGTLRTTPNDAPLLQQVDIEWADYYKNITEDDVRTAINVDDIFSDYSFSICEETHDLYFYGIKNGVFIKRNDTSWMITESPRRILTLVLQDKIDELKSENAVLRSRLSVSYAENRLLNEQYNAILGSIYWRLTRPLRAFSTSVRKIYSRR